MKRGSRFSSKKTFTFTIPTPTWREARKRYGEAVEDWKDAIRNDTFPISQRTLFIGSALGAYACAGTAQSNAIGTLATHYIMECIAFGGAIGALSVTLWPIAVPISVFGSGVYLTVRVVHNKT